MGLCSLPPRLSPPSSQKTVGIWSGSRQTGREVPVLRHQLAPCPVRFGARFGRVLARGPYASHEQLSKIAGFFAGEPGFMKSIQTNGFCMGFVRVSYGFCTGVLK